ncbi:MAG: branched-chain amino acid ABC transporter permease [Actinobacteria bacterium]|nr:MAG: branched-chain amino acid ABC transporter permease [Actinomycetota bacterium]
MRVLKRSAASPPEGPAGPDQAGTDREGRLERARSRVGSVKGRLARRRAAAVAWRARLPDLTGPVARAWHRLPRWSQWLVRLGIIVLAVLAPADWVGQIMAPASDWKTLLFYPIGIFVLLAVGLNVVVGQAGILDLGYVAFFAIGGYTMALLGVNVGLDFWIILPTAVALCAVSGLVLGTPALRLRGDYLAIVTLGFGEIIRISATNASWTGGPRGIAGIPHPPDIGNLNAFTYGVLDPTPYYYLVLALIVVVIFVARRLERSRVGRAWAAIREDEDAAALMGVPTFRFKLWAFAIGGSIGGGAGVMFSAKNIAITPDNFPLLLSILVLSAVVLGGSGNLPGVILGAFLVAWLPERFRGLADYRVLIFGAALVIMMIFRPEGLLPSRRRRSSLRTGTGAGAAPTAVVEQEEKT